MIPAGYQQQGGTVQQSNRDRKTLSFLIVFFSMGFRASRALIQAMY
jgi:hypothetical protein